MTWFVRFAGWCLIAAGLLITPTVFHPDIFDISIGEASLMPYWAAGHAAGLVAMVLTMFGMAGLVARYGARLGALGLAALVVTVPGIVLTACVAYGEAFVLPPLARIDPQLVDLQGPLLGSWPVRVLGGLALLWLVGLTLLGVALWRTRVVPRAAAGLLAVGAVGFGAFEGPFVPVLGVLFVIVFAAAHVWLGCALISNRANLDESEASAGAGNHRSQARPARS